MLSRVSNRAFAIVEGGEEGLLSATGERKYVDINTAAGIDLRGSPGWTSSIQEEEKKA